jgi:hypothetical protein
MGGNILNSEDFDFDAVEKLALLADILHLSGEGGAEAIIILIRLMI